MRKNFISEQEKKAIEDAVAEAEAKSSGEIVPMIVSRSSRYDWLGTRGAFTGWMAFFLIGLWLHFYLPFAFEYWETQGLQLLGLFLGWMVGRSRLGVKLFAAKEVLAEEVSQAAHVAFLEHGLVNTRDRTGILIFISLMERRVQILADKGIHEKVGQDFWHEETGRIVESIRRGQAAQGMLEAIRNIGLKLEAHFPRKVDEIGRAHV